jgi:hypothetical protein
VEDAVALADERNLTGSDKRACSGPADAIAFDFIGAAGHKNRRIANACHRDAFYRRVIAAHVNANAVELRDQPRPADRHIVFAVRVDPVLAATTGARGVLFIVKPLRFSVMLLAPNRMQGPEGTVQLTLLVSLLLVVMVSVDEIVEGMVVALAAPPRTTNPVSTASLVKLCIASSS